MLRKVSLDNFDAASRAMRAKTAPLIRFGSTGTEYAQTMTDKTALLGRAEPGETILWAWAGQWSTDVFELTVAQGQALVTDPRKLTPAHRDLFQD